MRNTLVSMLKFTLINTKMKPMRIIKTITPKHPAASFADWLAYIKLANKWNEQKNRIFNPKHNPYDTHKD